VPERPSLAAAAPAARLRAGALDGLVVALAAGLWALTAWAALGFPPPPPHALRHLLPAIAVAPALLAAFYQFLCFYCGGASWGMRHEHLYLVAAETENGAPVPASRRACRQRAWASLISMAALGLGYLWMLCDPQHLAWHDTISGTRILSRDAMHGFAAPSATAPTP
ncbi:MAG: RDD family protein, partial [Terriglobales bacterium]